MSGMTLRLAVAAGVCWALLIAVGYVGYVLIDLLIGGPR